MWSGKYMDNSTNNTISHLTITGGYSDIYSNGAGIVIKWAYGVQLHNLSIIDNEGRNGAGLYAYFAEFHLINSLIENNRAPYTLDDGMGGGIFIHSSNFIVIDSIIYVL